MNHIRITRSELKLLILYKLHLLRLINDSRRLRRFTGTKCIIQLTMKKSRIMKNITRKKKKNTSQVTERNNSLTPKYRDGYSGYYNKSITRFAYQLQFNLWKIQSDGNPF